MHNEAGEYIPGGRALCDLFMAPRKRTVYMNIYTLGHAIWHGDEEVARRNGKYALVTAMPIEIEE